MASMSGDFEAPLAFAGQRVGEEWVDFNGHMNVAYYLVAFDRCVDDMYNRLGIGPAQMAETQCSVFTLEAHINYLREVMEGDLLRIEGRLMDYDHKRLHTYFEMFHAGDGHEVAAMEQIGLNIDMTVRKPASFSDEVMNAARLMHAAHRRLPAARYAGRVIGIPRK